MKKSLVVALVRSAPTVFVGGGGPPLHLFVIQTLVVTSVNLVSGRWMDREMPCFVVVFFISTASNKPTFYYSFLSKSPTYLLSLDTFPTSVFERLRQRKTIRPPQRELRD